MAEVLEIELAGITPARAGKTNNRFQLPRISWDHPRSRGKDHVGDAMDDIIAGSPPLARERLIVPTVLSVHPGITPARAGKTGSAARFCISPGDHPRSRGKDSKRSLKNGDFSSPET